MKKNYVLNVGNIGNIECANKTDALVSFASYVDASKNNIGRASGESVTLFCNDEIVKEYVGTIDSEESIEVLDNWINSVDLPQD